MHPGIGQGTMLYGGRMIGDGLFGFGGLGILALIGFLFFTAVVVALGVWAVSRGRKPGSTPGAQTSSAAPTTAAPVGDTALAIARERLARGEIDPEQYTAIVTALGT
ncbi:MAG: hypothetical protein JXP72_08320 [Coriobacteriia bacterium]|nr:hypothetical protein [Coriobacteriia bacterium]